MTSRFRNILILCLLLTLTFGCKFFDQVQKKIEEGQKPKVIIGTDGKCQLTVPGSWSAQKDLNDDANIQVGNLIAEQYAVVISEPKIDFTSEMGLSGFADLVRKGINESIKTPILSENQSLQINGYPALQFEVSGSVDNIRARWIYTVIDAPENYYQIIAWTLNSKYDTNRPVLLEVAGSFREIEDSIALPPPPAPAKP